MKESVFQKKVIDRCKREFLGCEVIKMPSDYIQGIPDLLVLFGPYWAFLEVKVSEDARHQPNQDYYIAYYGNRGFARFIYPENEDQVFVDLYNYFRKGGNTHGV